MGFPMDSPSSLVPPALTWSRHTKRRDEGATTSKGHSSWHQRRRQENMISLHHHGIILWYIICLIHIVMIYHFLDSHTNTCIIYIYIHRHIISYICTYHYDIWHESMICPSVPWDLPFGSSFWIMTTVPWTPSAPRTAQPTRVPRRATLRDHPGILPGWDDM